MIPIPIILPIEYGSGGIKEWFLSLPLYLKILDICLAACLLNTLIFMIIVTVKSLQNDDIEGDSIVMIISLGISAILAIIISFISI